MARRNQTYSLLLLGSLFSASATLIFAEGVYIYKTENTVQAFQLCGTGRAKQEILKEASEDTLG